MAFVAKILIWGARQPAPSEAYVPTSAVLEDLFARVPPDVTPGWLIDNLRQRSFGIVLLLMAVIGLLPGVSGVVGILLAYPAWQLMRGKSTPTLPRFIASRRMSGAKVKRMGRRIRWPLVKLEAVIRPRWRGVFEVVRPAVGATILLLAVTLVWPFPLSNIAPSFAIMLLAIAHLEEDGALLILAMIGALAALAVTGATVWAAIRTTGWLDRLL